jgi:hypothetical protein
MGQTPISLMCTGLVMLAPLPEGKFLYVPGNLHVPGNLRT